MLDRLHRGTVRLRGHAGQNTHVQGRVPRHGAHAVGGASLHLPNDDGRTADTVGEGDLLQGAGSGASVGAGRPHVDPDPRLVQEPQEEGQEPRSFVHNHLHLPVVRGGSR